MKYESNAVNRRHLNRLHLKTGGICDLHDLTWINIYSVTLSLLSLISTAENLIIIITICKNELLHRPPTILLGILSAIDLVVGAVITPLAVFITTNYTFESFPYSKEFVVVFRLFVFLSLSTVLLICIDRSLTVFCLEKYRPTKEKLLIGIFSSWSIPFGIAVCWTNQWHVEFVTHFAIGYFFFCVFAMVFLYFFVVVHMKRSQTYQNSRNNNNNNNNAGNNDAEEDITLQREAVVTTFIIITTCILMNLPPTIDIYLRLAGKWSRGVCALTYLTLLGNSALNPVIYASRIRLIRRCVLELFGFRFIYDDDEDEQLFLTEVMVADDVVEGI